MQQIFPKIKRFFNNKYCKLSSYVLLAIFVILVVSYSFYSFSFNNKFYPNVKIGEINLGGKNTSEAKALLEQHADKVKNQDLIATGENLDWQISASNLKVRYDIEKSLNSAYVIGRNKSFWQNFKKRISLLFNSQIIIATFSYNNNEIDKLIADINQKLDINGQDATLIINKGKVEISDGKIGQEVNSILLDSKIISTIGYMKGNRKVVIPITKYQPKIKSSDLEIAKNEISRIIETPIELKWENKNYQFSSQDIGSWLEFSTVVVKEKNFSFSYLFNQKRIEGSVGNLGKDINQDPVDAKLSISSGRVTVFQSSEDGYELDQEKTATEIANILSARQKVAGVNSEDNPADTSELDLSVKVKKPAIGNDTINNLGIKEMIGAGTTNYKGSPENRKYNIALGASFFNGVLIKPGETFSFMGALGSVTEDKGFRKELVIKEDRTEPEVGGGLCQVSTTMFRAALNTGMEIVERSNHAYRVSYYEPPVGMDATVYDPSPDFKFKNNTPGYILIQSKIVGTTLTFEFYGTKDGRKIEISDSTIYDEVAPDAPIYVEDPNMAPGEEKQVEKAHSGCKAKFDYKVTFQDGKILTQKTFYSTFVPWQAKFLRGPALPEGSSEQNQNPPNP